MPRESSSIEHGTVCNARAENWAWFKDSEGNLLASGQFDQWWVPEVA
jgi:hypothetical protein